MGARKEVFISATSADLGSYRQVAKEAVLTLGAYPIEERNFPTDYRASASYAKPGPPRPCAADGLKVLDSSPYSSRVRTWLNSHKGTKTLARFFATFCSCHPIG